MGAWTKREDAVGNVLEMECSACGLRGDGVRTGVGKRDTLTEGRAAWCRHCEAIVSAEYVRPLAELRESNPSEMLADFARSSPEELMPLVNRLRSRPGCPECRHGVRQLSLAENGKTPCPRCEKPALGWVVPVCWD